VLRLPRNSIREMKKLLRSGPDVRADRGQRQVAKDAALAGAQRSHATQALGGSAPA
jgi:hypothetical protein